MFRCRSCVLLCLAFGDVVEVFDDGGYGGDSAEDGEYWDHGDSPLLRFLLFCPGVSRTYSYMQNPCQKENAFFEQKSQGGELGLYALMDAYTKSYTEIHFRMRCKTQKAPPKRSLKNLQQKRKQL